MYKLRLKILLSIFALVFIVILMRLGFMQILWGEYYRQEAQERLQSFQFSQGQRGRIIDRNNVILAEDETCHDFQLAYQFIIEDEDWAAHQKKLIRENEKVNVQEAERIYLRRVANTWKLAWEIAQANGVDIEKRLATIRSNVDRLYRIINRNKEIKQPVREQRMSHTIIGGLDDEMIHKLRDTNVPDGWGELFADTIGATLMPSHRRIYPQGDIACHIIGVTGPIFKEDAEKYNLPSSEADWLKRKINNYFAGDTIGKSGVEKLAENKLRPRRGFRRFGTPGETSQSMRAQPGQDVRLTIDVDLQRKLTELIKNSGYTGSIVVLDVANGDILAMVSWPTYDLNTYRTNYNSLITDRENRINLPLRHRAIASLYPPGSTIKPITALAGMGSGKISPNSELECTGTNPFARNGKPKCWIYKERHRWSTHGQLNVRNALKNSCNIYFVRVGQMLEADSLCLCLEQFGYGAKPGTGLPEERAGVVGDSEYLRREKNRSLLPSDSWNYSIGQGESNASPLQVAGAMATVARRGVYLSPRISTNAGPQQIKRGKLLPNSHVQAVHDGMRAVVHERADGFGTAYKMWNDVKNPPPNVKICGKTGTAQTWPMKIDLDGDGKTEIVKKGDSGWFAGFWPAKNPQYAFAVMVEYVDKGGGATAGPIAKEVVRIVEERQALGNRE